MSEMQDAQQDRQPSEAGLGEGAGIPVSGDAERIQTSIEDLSLEEARQMLHELQFRLAEVEKQNEELRCSRNEAEAVRIAHQRLMSMIEFLPDATFVIDQDKRVVAWNRACEVMTGVKKDAMLGRGDYASAEPFLGERRPILIDLLDVPSPEIEAKYEYVKRVGDAVIAESFIPRLRGGHGAYLWGAAAPLFDQEGRRCGAIEVVRDVTEQKHVERALRESELKHRTLFETANDAILLMRHDRFIDCNARTLTMYGCSREQIVGASLHEYSPPTQPDGKRSEERILEKISLALTEGPQFFEWECRQLDGTPFMTGVSLNRLELDGETLLQAIVRDITQRKQAEMALRANERKLSAIFEQAPLGIAIIDSTTGQFLKVNQQYCSIAGYTESEMLDLAFQQITHPDDLQKDLDNMQRLRVGELQLFQMEKRYIRKDGSVVWVNLTCVPLWGTPGTELQHIAMAEDITARKQSEEQLAESERKYRELVEHANSIILRWTHDGRITFLNEFGQRFFGYSSEEIIGRHVMGTIVPTADGEGRDLRQLMDEICADPVAFEQNVNENMRRNGERAWIAWTNRIVKDARGQVAEILSIGTDITERRRMLETLKESEAQLSLILNNVSDVIFAIAVEPNDNFRFISVNQRFLEVTGLPESQVVGALVQDIIPESAHAVVFKRYNEAIRSRQPAHWEEVSDYPTGRKIGHVTVVPAIDAHGTCTQLVGMVHDITEIKRAEEAIRELNTTLEQRVVQRTTELAVAKEHAEAADRFKSAFLATMSHELRTPLNSIIGFTGIILQGLAGPLNAEQHKQLEMVRDSARHLLALINDVLDISKIEAGQLQVCSEPFDLRASIVKVTGIVKPLAEREGLALRVEVAPDIGTLESDPRRVEQILLNLLNNAIKFTEVGSVTLTAEIALGTLRISVSDTGIGIKTEDLGKLFQSFRQIDTGLSRQHEGTGLGLAICRRLAELLGGEILVASEWNKGSTFTFTLPTKGLEKS